MGNLFDISSKSVPYFHWFDKPYHLYKGLLIPDATVVASIHESFGDMLFQGIERPLMNSWKSDYYIKETVVTHSRLQYRSIEFTLLLKSAINYNWNPFGWNKHKETEINLVHTLEMDSKVKFEKDVHYSTFDLHYSVDALELLMEYIPELVGPFLENYYADRNFTLFENNTNASPIILNHAMAMFRLMSTPGGISALYDLHSIMLLAFNFLWKAEIDQRRGLSKRQAEIATLFQTIRQHIQYNSRQFLGINYYAKMALMSPTQFKKHFHDLTDTTAFKTWENDRLHKAAGLLANTTDTVTHIAVEVHYADTQSFVKAFKKKYHETPSDFRERTKNNL